MSLSKQAVMFSKTNKFVEDFKYVRNHPMYDNWPEWKDIVEIYHSETTKKLQAAINKGFRNYDSKNFTISESYLIDEIYFQCCQKEAEISQNESLDSVTKPGMVFFAPLFEDDCKCSTEYCDTFNNDCPLKELHLKANLISSLWTYCNMNRYRKSFRKYFKRLERVILSLPYKYLINFDITLIVDPPRYKGRGRQLLKELYERAYFDKDLKKLPFKFEYLKHFIKQQGGAIPRQSFRDDIFVPGTIELGLELSKTMNFDKFQSKLIPHSQGILDFMTPTVHHTVDIEDRNFDKFRAMVLDSQRGFLEGLKDTIIESGKQLFCLFAAASTVCLLSRAVVSIGIKAILKLLHMIYALVAGTDDQPLIKRSFAHSQSGEQIEIPFIPTMILNYIISPPKDILTQIWNSPNTDRIMRRIGYLGDYKVEKGIERMIEWMNRVIVEVKRWYALNVLGIEWKDIESDCHVIVKWHEEVDDLIKTYFDGSFIWTDTTWGVVYNLYSRGLNFTREPAYAKYKSDVWKVVNKLGNILEQFKTHGCSNQQIRNPPVTIYLYGGTGAGKSSITYPLAVEILKGIFKKEKSPIDLKKYWKSLIYMRAPEQEFWDGYENQLVTVFDDFSQLVDGTASPNLELFEIIRASNCFPYPLHMASLDQKANTTFTSKVIIVSSNMSAPQTESLNYPDALKRRFDISIKVERNAKGHSNQFDPTQYKLTTYNMMTNLFEEVLSYDDLIRKCVDQYFARKNFVTSVEDYIMEKLSDFEQDLPKTPQQLQEEAESTYESYDTVDYPVEVTGLTFGDFETPIAYAQAGEKAWIEDFFDASDQPAQQEEQIEEINNTGNCQELWDGTIRSKPFSEKAWNWFNDVYMCPWERMRNAKAEMKIWESGDNKYRDECGNFDADRYVIDKVWEGLKWAANCVKRHVISLTQIWAEFKKKHSYLSKAMIMVSIIAAGLMFLRVFQNLRNAFSPDKPSLKPPQFVEGRRVPRAGKNMLEKIVLANPTEESYAAKELKQARVEAYVDKVPQVAKLEAYTPSQPHIAKLESYVASINQVPKSEGVKDINASEILLSVARKNLYKMYESTHGSAIGHVLFLKGQIAVMPKHYLVSLYQSLQNDRDASVTFEAVLLNRSFEMRVIDLLNGCKEYESPDENDGPVATRDLMACYIKTAIVHTDATSYFVTKGSVCRTDSTEVMLPVLCRNNMKKSDRPIVMIRYATGRSQLSKVESLPVADDDNIITRYIRDAWMYNLDTQDSECGSPLIIRNTQVGPGKICGIHVAGLSGTGQGWSTPIYHEDVIKILKMFPAESQLDMNIRLKYDDYESIPKEQCQIPPEAEFARLGALPRPVAQPSRTKIEPSPIHGKIQKPLTKPCALKPTVVDGKPFDPRGYRLGRLGNFPVAIPEKIIENATEALTDEISSVLTKTKDNVSNNIKAVYSFEEAVCGIEGEDFVNAIKRDTSAGFPFIQMKEMTRKDMFGTGQEYDLSSKQCDFVKARVEQIIASAKKGEVLDHYFVDTLKDERKPIHKAHKTRLFSAGPVDYLIACKMYFNGVVALLSKNRNYCHVSVGTNVYSNDWNEIVKVLHRKAKNIVAGDFEGFDASQQQRLLEMAAEVLIQLAVRFLNASPEDVLVMRVLIKTLINSLHITGREIYQWTHSLASGHYLTAIINSIFVNLVFACCWQMAFDDISYYAARSFWKECGIVAYGDDHLVSVPDSRLEIFNQFTVPKFMAMLGLSYTMEDKDASVSEKARPITEVSYLKRKFLLDNYSNKFICPLTLETILEFPMWVHRCPDPATQTIVELETAIKELSLHPKETWDQWFPKLNSEAQSLGHYTDLKEHQKVRGITLAQIDVW